MNPSPLRQRMLDELQMRGFAPKTFESYIGAVNLESSVDRP